MDKLEKNELIKNLNQNFIFSKGKRNKFTSEDINQFKRIYYNEQENIQEDNLNDQKMKKIVEEFKDKKKYYMNSNLRKNKSSLK